MHRVANKLNELLEFRCDYLVTKHHPEAQTQVYLNSILHVLYYLDRRKGKLSGKQRSRMYSYMVYTQADLLLRNRFEAIQNRRPKRPFGAYSNCCGRYCSVPGFLPCTISACWRTRCRRH